VPGLFLLQKDTSTNIPFREVIDFGLKCAYYFKKSLNFAKHAREKGG
jgi:hypothetical protein